ncbi:hypothetical protein Tco_0355298 [Tanacetum coccineum]
MTGVSREDALAFVIDVTNWNFLLKRLVYRYQNLTIAFSSGLSHGWPAHHLQRAISKYANDDIFTLMCSSLLVKIFMTLAMHYTHRRRTVVVVVVVLRALRYVFEVMLIVLSRYVCGDIDSRRETDETLR